MCVIRYTMRTHLVPMLTDYTPRPQSQSSMLVLARADTSLYTAAIHKVPVHTQVSPHTMMFPCVVSQGERSDV